MEVSADGVARRAAHPRVPAGRLTVRTPGAGHVRLVWPGGGSGAGPARATLRSAGPAPVDAPPAVPVPTAPAPGATGVIGPAFTWTAAAGAGRYTLAVSRRPDLGDPVSTVAGLVAPSFTPAAGLPPAIVHHRRVGARRRAPRNPGGDVITAMLVPAPARSARRSARSSGRAGRRAARWTAQLSIYASGGVPVARPWGQPCSRTPVMTSRACPAWGSATARSGICRK